MYLINYLDRFPADEDCVRYFRELREIKGIECPHCGSKAHHWNENLFKYSCLNCGNTIGLREATLLEGSPLPIKYWFLCIYLLTYPENAYSIEEVRSKLDYLGEQEIDRMLNKLENLILNSRTGNNFDMLLYYCV